MEKAGEKRQQGSAEKRFEMWNREEGHDRFDPFLRCNRWDFIYVMGKVQKAV
jgi:hypothetical protein